MGEVLDPTNENLRQVADCIADGGVAVTPSDTNLALTVDPWHADAIDRVYEMTGRPEDKPLTLFVHDPADWRTYGQHEDPDLVDAFVDAFWPGPLNIVLRRTREVPDERVCMGETVSIGCLSNPVWREIASHLPGPIAMTSANRTGEADDRLVDLELAREHVGDRVDYLVDGEPQGTTQSSTIIDLTGEPDIVRQGDVTPGELNAVRDLF